MLGLVVLAATEARLGSAGGWIACSPWSLGQGQAHRLSERRAGLNRRAGEVAEAELGGPCGAQRSAEGAGVSDRAVGAGMDVPAALGSVGVEGGRHCLAPAGRALGYRSLGWMLERAG